MNEPNGKRKIVCVLYDDPVEGYPPKYARDYRKYGPRKNL